MNKDNKTIILYNELIRKEIIEIILVISNDKQGISFDICFSYYLKDISI